MGRLRLLLVSVALATAFLVACSGGDDDEDVPTGSGGAITIHTLAPIASTAPDIDADFTTTDSGLQIATITDGDGEHPANGERVTVNYEGWLQDGALFDSSLLPGREPYSFILGEGNVIQGWDQGIPLMEVGGVYRLVIPPALGYGSAGSGQTIPPNSTLVFDISVISSEEFTPTATPTPFATVNSTPPPVNGDPVTTASGLQIYTISEGTGDLPKTGDTVTLDYTGWVQGGGQFDTSIGGQPFSFQIGAPNLIDGFVEGVSLMKSGGVYRLVIPPEIGYGADGSPPYIAPNATVIFDITIRSIAPPTPAP